MSTTTSTRPIVVSGRRALELTLDRCTVIVEEGPDQGLVAPLSSTSLRVGTDPSNELRLTDLTVSRHHAMITQTEDGPTVEDLGSKNGTWLDGNRVRSAFLRSGSAVKVGETVLRVRSETERLVVFPDDAPEDRLGILGRSQAIRDLIALVRQLARTDLPVLITGETGCGKELLAQALHAAGPRRDRPFLVFDCGSIVPGLVRSELFGHERGAFTGADRASKGILEEATGGTVFFDEIGEIDLSVQPNLLRALETRQVCRLGSRKPVTVDFRVVSATNRSLGRMCAENRFRPDLYYRLSCFTIEIPPLRERREDIPVLAEHFLASAAIRNALPVPAITPEARAFLESLPWPGNVRELRNVMEAATVLATDRKVLVEHLERALRGSLPAGSARAGPDAPPVTPEAMPASTPGALEEAEKQVLARALAETGWNRKAAAKKLGISHTTMFAKIKRYGLRPPDES